MRTAPALLSFPAPGARTPGPPAPRPISIGNNKVASPPQAGPPAIGVPLQIDPPFGHPPGVGLPVPVVAPKLKPETCGANIADAALTPGNAGVL